MEHCEVRRERLLLVDRLQDLPEEQWHRPSLCAGWEVRHVLAHLVTPFLVSAPAMALAVARARGIGAAMDAAARRIGAEREPAQLLATLREHAGSSFRPPGLPASAPLVDVVAHSADIRWALDDPPVDWAAPGRLAPVLDFLTSTRARAGFVPAGGLRGLSLAADDQDWSWGSGALVRGSSLALSMALLGRPAARTLVRGEGAARLLPDDVRRATSPRPGPATGR